LHLYFRLLTHSELLATQTFRRTQYSRAAGLLQRPGLVRGGDHGRSGTGSGDSGKVLILKDQGSLQHHLHLGSAGDVDIRAAGKQRYQAHRGQPCTDSGNSTGKRMSAPEPAY
jgi:hypothetical protein